MKTKIILLERILPIESSLRWRRVQDLYTFWDEKKNAPLIAVPSGSNYLIADGHNRAAVLFLRGKDSVQARVLETDEDISKCSDGALYKDGWDEGICTLDGFLGRYLSEWRPACVSKGIYSFRDLMSEKNVSVFVRGWFQRVMGDRDKR
ncbi:MAG: hypothetical protein KKB21_02805 [Nanoarchaeota archaeon]|nr:hypothetical protein [Nanoarchaeota archaeon]MBU4086485.1 hypothetical protein [Nanoarchaeota archaeon]